MIDPFMVEMLLMQYAAGALSPYEALMVAAHVSVNPESRRKISRYEAEGGRMICDEKPAPVKSDCLDSVLRKIDGCGENNLSSPSPHNYSDDSLSLKIPAPVLDLLYRSCGNKKLCWQQVAQGIRKIDLNVCTSEPRRRRLRLIHLMPGQATPLHAHAGREVTVVLDGGFTDCTGHYAKGDIVIVDDPRFVHSPKADDTGCLSLTLTDAPLRFTQPVVQFFSILRRY